MWCLQGRHLEVPHPHGAVIVLGVLGCLASGHLDPVEPPTDIALAVVPLGLADNGVALLDEVVVRTWTRVPFLSRGGRVVVVAIV